MTVVREGGEGGIKRCKFRINARDAICDYKAEHGGDDFAPFTIEENTNGEGKIDVSRNQGGKRLVLNFDIGTHPCPCAPCDKERNRFRLL